MGGRRGGEILEMFSKNQKIELIRKINISLQKFFGGEGSTTPSPLLLYCYIAILPTPSPIAE